MLLQLDGVGRSFAARRLFGDVTLDVRPGDRIALVGPNGTGKTTSIAKLASQLRSDGSSVMLGSADTFRAAADEQLRTWADRVGVDIVSGGELYRALKAGIEPQKIVYSGVGKPVEDMEYALLSDILMFNAESSQEISKLNEVAERLGKRATVAIRVNPDIDPKTHPYISTGLRENKFGIDIRKAPEEYTRERGSAI